MSGPNWRCIGPWPLCGHPRNTCTASPAYQAAIKVKHASSMTTLDIAGLCERLRRPGLKSAAEAAAALERQAAEIARLRRALERLASSEAFDLPQPIDGPLAQELRMRLDYARAALTGEDTATLSLSGKTQTDARTRGDG